MRKRHPGVLDRRLDAFLALLDRRVGEADNREVRKTARRVHFYFDDCPLQPDDGAGVDDGEHAPSVEANRDRVNCARRR